MILFLNDTWIGDKPLRKKYPRIYSILKQKRKLIIKECGSWETYHWTWKLVGRRGIGLSEKN